MNFAQSHPHYLVFSFTYDPLPVDWVIEDGSFYGRKQLIYIFLPALSSTSQFHLLKDGFVFLPHYCVYIVLAQRVAYLALLHCSERVLYWYWFLALSWVKCTELRLRSSTLLLFLRIELLRADDCPLTLFFYDRYNSCIFSSNLTFFLLENKS